MTNNIQTRLRVLARAYLNPEVTTEWQAADEIARLTDEVERLEKYKNIILEEHFEEDK